MGLHATTLRRAARPLALAAWAVFGAADCAVDEDPDVAAGRADGYSVAWHPRSCIMARVLKPRLQICIRGNGDFANAERMTRRALEAWLVPLRERFEGVATEIEFGCDRPDGTVNVYRGNGRAHASPGVVLGIYDSRPLGSWIHEFGHAFACLGDTYVGGTAGSCAPGQPRSIMCYGLLLNQITADDVAGVVHQAERLNFPRITATPPDAGVTPGPTPTPTPDAGVTPGPTPTPTPDAGVTPGPTPTPTPDRCAAASACGTCTPLSGCAWCGAAGRCVPVNRDGLPAGACANGFALNPSDCPSASGVTACGRYASWSIWTCVDDRTRVRCRGGSLEREVCATRCDRRPTGVDDLCS